MSAETPATASRSPATRYRNGIERSLKDLVGSQHAAVSDCT